MLLVSSTSDVYHTSDSILALSIEIFDSITKALVKRKMIRFKNQFGFEWQTDEVVPLKSDAICRERLRRNSINYENHSRQL